MFASFKTPFRSKRLWTALTQAGRGPPSESRERLREQNSGWGTRRQAGCFQRPGSGPRAPPAATCRRGPARPHPRQRLLSSCHPFAATPSPAGLPLTSSSGVRLSRSPQQQHHRQQQQHTDPLHPAIFLLSCRSGPPRPTPPPTQDPCLT